MKNYHIRNLRPSTTYEIQINVKNAVGVTVKNYTATTLNDGNYVYFHFLLFNNDVIIDQIIGGL